MSRVYFIRPVGMEGPVKIGTSVLPDRRLGTLSTWCPFDLEIVAQIAGDHKVERRFHTRHAAARTHGEWFDATPALLADIAAINAGSFDLGSLPETGKSHDRSRIAAVGEVERLIATKGGPSAVAAALGLPVTTVHSWQRRNRIPQWRMAKLAEMALNEGKSVPASFDGAAA